MRPLHHFSTSSPGAGLKTQGKFFRENRKIFPRKQLFSRLVIMTWMWIFLLLLGCAKKEDSHTLRIAASSVPHSQMLRFIRPMLSEKGVTLKILEIDDYHIPNRALVEKEVDANFFQHIPFMEQQIDLFGYPIQCFAKIHLEPMAIYSSHYKNLRDLPMGATIALPSDPTNEYRALAILQREGIIELRPDAYLHATKADITRNPKNLNFREIDPAMLPRTLRDVDAAAIPTNFALQVGLNPTRDALVIESIDSPYANIIAIRDGEENDPRLIALKEAMLSDQMRRFIEEKYQGAIIPVLTECLVENQNMSSNEYEFIEIDQSDHFFFSSLR